VLLLRRGVAVGPIRFEWRRVRVSPSDALDGVAESCGNAAVGAITPVSERVSQHTAMTHRTINRHPLVHPFGRPPRNPIVPFGLVASLDLKPLARSQRGTTRPPIPHRTHPPRSLIQVDTRQTNSGTDDERRWTGDRSERNRNKGGLTETRKRANMVHRRNSYTCFFNKFCVVVIKRLTLKRNWSASDFGFAIFGTRLLAPSSMINEQKYYSNVGNSCGNLICPFLCCFIASCTHGMLFDRFLNCLNFCVSVQKMYHNTLQSHLKIIYAPLPIL
jgi:hypothetical protein